MKEYLKYITIFILGVVFASLIFISNLQVVNIEENGVQKNGLVTMSIFDYSFDYYFER